MLKAGIRQLNNQVQVRKEMKEEKIKSFVLFDFW